MQEQSGNNPEKWNQLRKKIIGLGETSLRKSHYPALQQRQAENETIRIISELFLDIELLDDALNKLPGILSERFKFPLAAITLINKHTGRLEIIAQSGSCCQHQQTTSEEIIREISANVVETGTMEITGTGHTQPDIPTTEDMQACPRIICAPLKIRQQCIGTIFLADTKEKQETDSEISTLKVIANYLAQEINRKQTESEIQDINRQLSDYIYIVTNYLKNPLFTLKGYLFTIKEEPESFEEHFDRLVFQTDKMISVLEKLIQLSRAGKIKLRKEIIDISSHLQAVFNILKHQETKATLNIAPDIPDIRGDQGSIIQIISSIIQNCFDFRDPDKEEVIINITGSTNAKAAIISISDNGLGIRPANTGKIFNPGFTIGKKSGAGFGLSIAKKLMEAHGGEITPHSEGHKQGTEFKLIFPV
jgi:signal transduction histidine kinase